MKIIEFSLRLKLLLGQNFFLVLSRVVAAILGGYVLANCLSILLAYLLPLPQADGVLVGIQASFAIYAVAVIWVFAAKTAKQAWFGLLIPGLVSSAALYFLLPEGLL